MPRVCLKGLKSYRHDLEPILPDQYPQNDLAGRKHRYGGVTILFLRHFRPLWVPLDVRWAVDATAWKAWIGANIMKAFCMPLPSARMIDAAIVMIENAHKALETRSP